MRGLAENNDEPTRASRPFDALRSGFVIGEGAGVLVLEELEAARARGATVHAEILGYGASNDAFHLASPEPEATGVADMMRNALDRADVSPERVGYINAHGTSTPLGDAAETRAIKAVFGAHAYRLAVSSTKSVMGHCFGAAGTVEAMMCVLAVRDGVLPPTINYEHPDPECDLDYDLVGLDLGHDARASSAATARIVSDELHLAEHRHQYGCRRFPSRRRADRRGADRHRAGAVEGSACRRSRRRFAPHPRLELKDAPLRGCDRGSRSRSGRGSDTVEQQYPWRRAQGHDCRHPVGKPARARSAPLVSTHCSSPP